MLGLSTDAERIRDFSTTYIIANKVVVVDTIEYVWTECFGYFEGDYEDALVWNIL